MTNMPNTDKLIEADTFTLAEVEVGATDLAEETADDVSPPTSLGITKKPIDKIRLSIMRQSTMSDIPFTDTNILKELMKEDENACFTLAMIAAMRQSIECFSNKESVSDNDASILEEKQQQLMEKLKEFDGITLRVQHLLELSATSNFQSTCIDKLLERTSINAEETTTRPSDLSAEHSFNQSHVASPAELEMHRDVGVQTGESSTPDLPDRGESETIEFGEPTSDDKLPKVVVCGLEDHIPMIVVCDPSKGEKNTNMLNMIT